MFRFILVLCFSISLFGASYETTLQKYRSLKSAYTRAILDNDISKQKTLLQDLIFSGKKLDFNTNYYTKKLNVLDVKPKQSLRKKNKLSNEFAKIQQSVVKKAPHKTVIPHYTKVLVIDPGHGGKDPGAMANRYKEKDIVLQVAKKLKSVLNKRGYTVYLTRNSDKFIELEQRTSMAFKKNADLFVSLHVNSHRQRANPAKGVETYFLSPAKTNRANDIAKQENIVALKYADKYTTNTFLKSLNKEKVVISNKLAIDIQKGILSSSRAFNYQIQDRGVRSANFWVLTGIEVPSVLIELGYITHKQEANRLNDKNYQSLLANGIANGIESFFIKNDN